MKKTRLAGFAFSVVVPSGALFAPVRGTLSLRACGCVRSLGVSCVEGGDC